MSPTTDSASSVPDETSGVWQLDPSRSSVEFHVRHFYGLMTVKGRFGRYQGTLKLDAEPVVELTIDADSLDTKMAKRDKHLRSADFFNVADHPQVQFVSDSVTLDGETLKVRGELHAAGRHVPMEIEAAVRRAGDDLELEARTLVDQRELGMTWSPVGITRAPSTLIVSGRLVRAQEER
jgi:polyisoprenoid-binding protein YceI